MFSEGQHSSIHHCYEIQHTLRSGPALLLFARYSQMNESVVIKILQKYKDTRYGLDTLEARQRCQLKALVRNRRFTPEANVYIGLGRISKQDEEKICFDEIVLKSSPARKKTLTRGAEYALLMKQLADERRLDILLHAEKHLEEEHLIASLVGYVAHMHSHLARHISPAEKWGSTDQLYRKLRHNIELLELVATVGDDRPYRKYYTLKDNLLSVFEQERYKFYFERRKQERYIRRCHGDLKASNIWIEPYDLRWDSDLWKHVLALDAVDFNPMYSNIDILSDFAMLVVDIMPMTGSFTLIHRLIKDYLERTEQDDIISRSVLAYYLVEKALVRAAVSIVYDHQPEIGLHFLQMAEMLKADLEGDLVIV